jgi:hypothetical protein
MKIKAHCNEHPNSLVLMLEATAAFTMHDQPRDPQYSPSDQVVFDVANTYCTADGPHEIVFKVYNTDGHWLCDAE